MKKQLVPFWARGRRHLVGWFFEPTYECNVYLCYPHGKNYLLWKDIETFFKSTFKLRTDEEFADSDPAGRTWSFYDEKSERRCYLVFISHWDPKKTDDYNTLAHEVFHATHQILEERDIPLEGDPAHEAYAYLHGSLMARMLTILFQKPPK